MQPSQNNNEQRVGIATLTVLAVIEVSDNLWLGNRIRAIAI